MPGTAGYARLLRPLLPAAAAYARALLRNRHDAEDAVQQAALRGLERFDRFDASRPFKAWWFTLLRNHCLDVLRARGTARTEPLGDADPPAPEAAEEFDWARLDAGIERLSSEHREILRLRYFGDMSYRDLAEALRIPPGTVMSRLHAARQALGRLIREDDT